MASIEKAQPQRFTSVTKTEAGRIRAANTELALEYEFTPEQLKVHFQVLQRTNGVLIVWRPSRPSRAASTVRWTRPSIPPRPGTST